LRHRFAQIEEIDDLRFEITAVTFSEGCFHAAYSFIPWSNILAHLIPLRFTPEIALDCAGFAHRWAWIALGYDAPAGARSWGNAHGNLT
jgi:hypothetical protein